MPAPTIMSRSPLAYDLATPCGSAGHRRVGGAGDAGDAGGGCWRRGLAHSDYPAPDPGRPQCALFHGWHAQGWPGAERAPVPRRQPVRFLAAIQKLSTVEVWGLEGTAQLRGVLGIASTLGL